MLPAMKYRLFPFGSQEPRLQTILAAEKSSFKKNRPRVSILNGRNSKNPVAYFDPALPREERAREFRVFTMTVSRD